jgi:hypothetical protein
VCTQGNANSRDGQRGRVVDAIAHHHDGVIGMSAQHLAHGIDLN